MLKWDRRSVVGFGVAIAVLATVWLAMLLIGLGPADRTILQAVYLGQHPHLKFIARHLGHLGAPEAVMMLTLAAGVVLLVQRRYWLAPVPLAVTVFAHVTAIIQRTAIGRPRPDGLIGLPHLHSPSFPPARVVDPMTAYLLVALIFTNGGRDSRLIVAAAAVIGASNGFVRVLLGHHWPSDVIAGWSFGAAVALVAYAVTTLLPDRDAPPRLTWSRAPVERSESHSSSS